MKVWHFLVFFVYSWNAVVFAQSSSKLHYNGQLAGWTQYAPDQPYTLLLGGHYIPQLSYILPLAKNTQTLNALASLNIYGTTATADFDSARNDGKIDPYRIYVKWELGGLSLVGGLQELRFGSAKMFRSVAWFDRTDPRDPLQLSDGVWGLTGRYYFPGTKLNLWAWFLYGNKDPKGIDILSTNQGLPEMGGRLQWKYLLGNIGLAYHFRRVDTDYYLAEYNWTREHRFGLDAHFDWRVGVTIEATSLYLSDDADIYTHQSMATLGLDYTFGLGRGLKTNLEQYVSALNEQTFQFENSVTFSGLSLAYPITPSDDMNYMLYYNWTNQMWYNYIRWSHRFKYLALHTMAFWNPSAYGFDRIQAFAQEHMLGKGVQVMLVWNH